tara:strand:+ start:92180 stop:94537 length:2358 start_codon:yes stop_codon:yes gene_type:complete
VYYKLTVIIFHLFLVISKADVFEGYVIFTPGQGGAGGNSTTSYLMDHNSDVVHTWSHDRSPASMPYLFPDSTIIYPYRVPSPSMNAGGVGGGIRKYNWGGTILWDYQFSDNTYQHHHDIEPLPNGNVLIIVWERKTSVEAYAMGRQTINNPLNQMWSEAVLELDPETGGIVWEWHLWDHLCQDISSQYPNYVDVSEHPELFDINNGNVGSSGGPGGANADWMHINAIAYNSDLDQVILSSRHQDEIFIIDHSTTTEEAAGHSGGNSGVGGDLLFRWGNPQNYDRGNNSDRILDAQHGVNWIPSGYPGEGNLILFNNGHTNQASAVLELTPPLNSNGTYEISANDPFGPENTVWSYSAGSSVQSDVQSGAFRLPNGNTLITEADDAYIFEVNYSGSVEWSYTHPGNDIMIARAQKYGLDYFTQNNDMTLIVDYVSDWNMVGLPLFVENSNQTIIFPEAVEGTLYSFSGGYVQEVDLTPGVGYWLRFPFAGLTQVTGEPTEGLSISLNTDWNLISGISSPLNVNNIIDTDNLIIPGTLYGFQESGYTSVEIISPGYGYWIRSSGEGEITLSSFLSGGRIKSFQISNNANTLKIGNQTLYFGSDIEIEDPLSFSLPPLPPAGVKDIRFSGNTKLCTWDECKVELMNDNQLIQLEANIKDGSSWEIVDNKGNVVKCEGLQILELVNELETFILRKSANARSISNLNLYPAHPNPFNPVTTIRFNISEISEVDVSIYNIQGRLVENLLKGQLSEGDHNLQWNANKFPSGVYFVMFEGNKVKEIEKIVFVK